MMTEQHGNMAHVRSIPAAEQAKAKHLHAVANRQQNRIHLAQRIALQRDLSEHIRSADSIGNHPSHTELLDS